MFVIAAHSSQPIRNRAGCTAVCGGSPGLGARVQHSIRSHPPPSLTWVVVGAAMVPEGMDKMYRDRFGHDFTISYGLTENPTTVSRSHEQTARLPGAVGHPLFHLEVGICDETGATLAPGAPGEICVRAAAKGPWANVYTPALGYWNNAEATAKLLKDGWLHTGDVGYLDERGELYVQDRRSDLINRGGANVYPAEIDRVLREESAGGA